MNARTRTTPTTSLSASSESTHPVCACGHSSDWHSHDGTGDCEHDGECRCAAFRPGMEDEMILTFVRDKETPEEGFVQFYAPGPSFRGGEIGPDNAVQLTMAVADWRWIGCPDEFDPITFGTWADIAEPHEEHEA